MKFSTLAIVLCLQLCVGSISQGADIIWVGQGRGGGDGENNPGPGEGSLSWEDDLWRQLIEGQGHNIVAHAAYDDLENTSFDEYDAQIAEFNAVDLVIFSRDSSSGDYNDPIEHETWTSDFETPLIIMSPYMLRNNRWGMVDNASIVDSASPMLATVPDHPLFNGVELDEFDELEFWMQLGDADNIDLVNTTDFGFAEVIAEESATGIPWIAYWDGEAEDGDFFDGSPTIAGGPRLFLSAGSDDDPNTWGEKNITPAGDQIVLNAIEFLTGDAGNPVVVCAPGTGDFDGNGKVEFADFLVMSATFGTEAGADQGDVDCNGRVEFADFLVLSANFGQEVGAVSAVPEPHSFLLFAAGAMIVGWLRQRDIA